MVASSSSGKPNRSQLFLDVAVLVGVFAVAYAVFTFFGAHIMSITSQPANVRQYSAEEIAQIEASLASSTAVDPAARPYTAEEVAQIQASLEASKSVQTDIRTNQ